MAIWRPPKLCHDLTTAAIGGSSWRDNTSRQPESLVHIPTHRPSRDASHGVEPPPRLATPDPLSVRRSGGKTVPGPKQSSKPSSSILRHQLGTHWNLHPEHLEGHCSNFSTWTNCLCRLPGRWLVLFCGSRLVRRAIKQTSSLHRPHLG